MQFPPGSPTTTSDGRGETISRRPATFAPLAAAAAVGIFLYYLAMTPWTTLWDRDEPRFAQATVEMLATRQYLYPTFNGHLRPDKPILIYWLMALPMHLLGARELAARFWSPVGLALAALATSFIGRRLIAEPAGLWTLGVLATTPLAFYEGLAATTDAVLLAAIVGSLAAFAATWSGGSASFSLVGMTACLALAQLAKGPVGLAVPVLAIAGALVCLRWRRPAARTGPYAAIVALAALLSAGLFLAWAIPADQATFGEFARQGIGHHVVERSLSPLEGHGGTLFLGLPFYLFVVLIGFAPWTLFLPGAISAVLGGRIGGEPCRALLIGWVVPVLAMFALIATRLPHYVLPLWPALVLAVAGTLAAESAGLLAERDRRWLRRGVWLFAPVALLEAAGLLAVAWTPPAAKLRGPCLALAAVLLATATGALRRHAAGEWRRSARFLLGGTLLAQALAAFLVLPALDQLKPVPPVAAAIREKIPAGAPLATFEFDEPSLIFYAGRVPVAPLRSESAVAAWARAGGTGVLVLPRAALGRVRQTYGALPLREIAAARGINVSKGIRLELVALARNLPEERTKPQVLR